MEKNIVAICGSIRKSSSNLGVLLALKKQTEGKARFEIFDAIDEFPHFNPDLETPAIVLEFKRKLKEAEVFIISTPEYAHGIPGVLKNALDWVVSDEDFPGKTAGVVIGSAGEGRHAKESLVEILRTMSANVNDEAAISILGIRSKVAHDGTALDEETNKRLEDFLRSLL